MTLAQLSALIGRDGGSGSIPAGVYNTLRDVQAQVANTQGSTGVPLIGSGADTHYDLPRRADGFPDWSAAATTPTALASRGRSSGGIATLQKDTISPDDYVASANPLAFGQTNDELVRAQIRSGGSAALNILRENSDGVTPQLSNGSMDYTGIKPVTSGDELLSNKTFKQLAQQDPNKASQIYKHLVGSDFATDIQQKQKLRLSMGNDYREGIRKGFIEGNLRRNPEQGWLERRHTIPSMMPGEAPTELWEPVDAVMQQADRDYNATATGYTRPKTLLDHIDDPQMQNRFLSSFYAKKKEGAADKDAAQFALDTIRGPSLPAKLAAEAAKPKVATVQTPPPTDPVAYQQWATEQAQGQWEGAGNAIMGLNDAEEKYILDPAARAVDWVKGLGRDVTSSIYNLPNKVAVGISGKPLYPWLAPTDFSPSTPTDFRPDYLSNRSSSFGR